MKKMLAAFAVAAMIAAPAATAGATPDPNLVSVRTYTNPEGTTWTFRTYLPAYATSVIRTGTAGWCSTSFLPTDPYHEGAMCGFPPGVGTTEVPFK